MSFLISIQAVYRNNKRTTITSYYNPNNMDTVDTIPNWADWLATTVSTVELPAVPKHYIVHIKCSGSTVGFGVGFKQQFGNFKACNQYIESFISLLLKVKRNNEK